MPSATSYDRGKERIDGWQDHALTEHADTILLHEREPVSIQLDYYENHGQAAVKVTAPTSRSLRPRVTAQDVL